MNYLKGPAHRVRADQLEAELSQLRVHCAQVEETAKKLGAMEIVEVRRLIDDENQRLQSVRAEIEKPNTKPATKFNRPNKQPVQRF